MERETARNVFYGIGFHTHATSTRDYSINRIYSHGSILDDEFLGIWLGVKSRPDAERSCWCTKPCCFVCWRHDEDVNRLR
jgi:hypothetical protein